MADFDKSENDLKPTVVIYFVFVVGNILLDLIRYGVPYSKLSWIRIIANMVMVSSILGAANITFSPHRPGTKGRFTSNNSSGSSGAKSLRFYFRKWSERGYLSP